MREFNVVGNCVPNMHYMVDISKKIDQIFQLVEGAKYFTINRGRQYGKTTSIGMLEKRLPDDYICASISFQDSSSKMFANEKKFCQSLLEKIYDSLSLVDENEANHWLDNTVTEYRQLSKLITKRCRDKKIVLIIDESDKASNNNLFVEFLGVLREKYLKRNAEKDYTFHSVILAGVYDIRNLKQKMILQGNYVPSSGESLMNSPWNIAVDFKIDMSFSVQEIETMLVDYENDHHTGMDISIIANEIRFYTSGYPYLVSKICQLIETDLDKNWTIEGVQEAIKLILKEKSTLFDDMIKKVEENQALSDLIFDLTVGKIQYEYNVDDPVMDFGLMFGFIAEETNGLQMHNKIFEIRITNYFVSKTKRNWREQEIAQTPFNDIVKDGFFNMELCLTKFKQHYSEIYTAKDLKFLERDGKLIFLTYLKPLINGFGFYHFESETRDFGRMDLVVDFLKQQFIIELKLWYGDEKHTQAYEQLAKYLKSKNMDRGYLITYDFRKKRAKSFKPSKWVNYDGIKIFDVILRVGEEE
ncbi:MAG: AAA-like domain-containing protein [Marinilabiliaceae bacterium]|nr:AAA-like domain-containing protein [Marinilabiliaceae bacterium]